MGVLLSQGFSELEIVQQRHQKGQAHPGQDSLGGVRPVMDPVDDGLDQQKGEQDREDKKQEYHHKRDLLSSRRRDGGRPWSRGCSVVRCLPGKLVCGDDQGGQCFIHGTDSLPRRHPLVLYVR